MRKPLQVPDTAPGTPRKPKLLLVGEGPQDIGRKDAPGGALAGFLSAVLCGPGDPVEHHELPFEIADLRLWRELQLSKTSKRPKTLNELLELEPDGQGARAAMVIAELAALDGVVIMRDCERAGHTEVGQLLRRAREAYDVEVELRDRFGFAPGPSNDDGGRRRARGK
jgi:hypothetical protein